MFDLELGDDLDLVVETARKLTETELTPHLRESEAARGVSDALHATWNEVGLTSLELPEALHGAGLGCLARVLVNEELAAGDAGAALALDPYGPALTALLEIGGEAAAAELVRATGQGRERAILVLAEDARVEIVADRIDLHLAPLEVLVDEHATAYSRFKRMGHVTHKLGGVLHYLHSAASEHVAWSHEHGVSDFLRDVQRLFEVRNRRTRRIGYSDASQKLLEQVTV